MKEHIGDVNEMITAVEYLEGNLIATPYDEEDVKHNKKCWEQAKEMEKEQLKEMYLKGIENYDPTFKQQEQ